MTRNLRPENLGTILSVWAHPDDETYLAGGVMAAARDRGLPVVCASATAGELGTDDPATWPPDRLGAIRRMEASASMTVLGVTDHRFGGLPDGDLATRDADGIAWIEGLLDDVLPDTVLTFGPEGMTYHPDHIAVHRWVTEVWRQRGCVPRLLYATPTVEALDRFRDLFEEWNMYMSDERPDGVPTASLAVHLSLDGAALDRKLVALRAMASQTNGLVAHIGLDAYLDQIAEEAFVEAAGVSVAELVNGRALTSTPEPNNT